MGLLEKLQTDLVVAQKKKDELGTSTIRFLLANLHNAKIEKGRELKDEEVTGQLKKEVKRHQESIEAFKSAGRAELVAKEEAEKAIIERYLPKGMELAEIGKLVDQAIAEVGAGKMDDFGKVMGAVMAKVAGRADGIQVAQVVKEKLGKS